MYMTNSKALNIKGEKDITANSNKNRKKIQGKMFLQDEEIKVKTILRNNFLLLTVTTLEYLV